MAVPRKRVALKRVAAQAPGLDPSLYRVIGRFSAGASYACLLWRLTFCSLRAMLFAHRPLRHLSPESHPFRFFLYRVDSPIQL